jgi:hypothetical protein
VLRLGYTGRTFGYKCSLHEGVIEKRHARSISTQFKVPDWQEPPKSIFISLPIRGVPPLTHKAPFVGASFCLRLLRTKAAPRIDRVD